jgi:CheY-like chemotaxis protein
MVSGEDTVLVVEDEGSTRSLLTQILEFEGFKAIGFANGAEALDYLTHSEAPCLIVLDMRMPVMDGPQFRSALLQDPRLARIPVVIVTAFDPSSAAHLSALRVFRKPVDIAALLSVVRKNC